MSRNRLIFQSKSLFVGPTPATGYHFSSGNSGTNLVTQLHRIQSANYSLQVDRTDVNQFGQLAALDQVILTAPTVSLDFSYLLANAINESRLGFNTDGVASILSGILNKTQDEKNYFILVTPEGTDSNFYVGAASTESVIGVGNGFLSSYSTEAAVGGFPTASVNVVASNIKFDVGSTGQPIPAVNPANGLLIQGINYSIPDATSGIAGAVAALRPGDITVDISGVLGFVASDLKIQSYTLSFDLNREDLNKLGSTFPFSREIQFPVTFQAEFTANVGDLTSGSLSDIICNDQRYNLLINLKKPSCSGDGALAIQYRALGVKLSNQALSSSIGPSDSITLSYVGQIGGPSDTTAGIFLSGVLV